MAGKAGSGASGGDRVIREAKNGNTKVIRTTGARWSAKAEKMFLDELAATANVRAAAQAAGFSTTAIYNRRKKWPGFAAEWDACLEQGYVRIETMLIAAATDSLSGGNASASAGEGPPPVLTGPAMTVSEAMNLLRLHRASVRGGAPQRYGSNAKAPDFEVLKQGILRKIEAIVRADARKTGAGTAGEG